MESCLARACITRRMRTSTFLAFSKTTSARGSNALATGFHSTQSVSHSSFRLLPISDSQLGQELFHLPARRAALCLVPRMHTHTHTHIHVHAHAHMCTHTTHAHTHHKHTQARTCMHTRPHMHAHTHTHARAQTLAYSLPPTKRVVY